MSVDPATTPSLDRLRRSRAEHEPALRRIRFIVPFPLGVFVLAAVRAHPRPGLNGRDLGVSLAVAGYAVAIVGAIVPCSGVSRSGVVHSAVAAQLAVGIVVFASSVMLLPTAERTGRRGSSRGPPFLRPGAAGPDRLSLGSRDVRRP